MTRTAHKKSFLLGIRITPFETKPVFIIDKWKVYNAGALPIENPHRNLNLQIERDDNEKIVLRIFLNDKVEISHAKYYFIKGVDEELSFYLCMSVIHRLSNKYSLSTDFIIKQIKIFQLIPDD